MVSLLNITLLKSTNFNKSITLAVSIFSLFANPKPQAFTSGVIEQSKAPLVFSYTSLAALKTVRNIESVAISSP